MSEPTPPFWLAWVAPFVATFGLAWVVIRKLFVTAVREQMVDMHEENKGKLATMGERMSMVENTLSRIEGRMQEHWGDYRGDYRGDER